MERERGAGYARFDCDCGLIDALKTIARETTPDSRSREIDIRGRRAGALRRKTRASPVRRADGALLQVAKDTVMNCDDEFRSRATAKTMTHADTLAVLPARRAPFFSNDVKLQRIASVTSPSWRT